MCFCCLKMVSIRIVSSIHSSVCMHKQVHTDAVEESISKELLKYLRI